jgi:putative ABC transport system permease protein
MLDGLQEILFTLRQNKLRTLLTAFGVFWGIFMLILLLGAGRGMQNGVTNDFAAGVDWMIISSGETSTAYRGLGLGRRIQLDETDIQAIAEQIDGIRVISSETFLGSGGINFKKKYSNAQIGGVPDEYFDLRDDVPFRRGRKPNPFDVDEVRKVVVIGENIAERLFAVGEDPIGKEIRVKDVVMKITGVFDDKGDLGRNSERVLMPRTTFESVFGGGDRIDSIWVRPSPGVDAFELERKIVAMVKRRHNVATEDIRGVTSFNMAEPAKRIHRLFIGINVFIWFVGLGTLMAGIVGISNIMFITVRERTREIGIRKALGATPLKIVSTLLLESTLVTAIAGYVGLVCGVALLEVVAYGLRSAGAKMPYFLNPEVDFQVAITAIALLVGAGILAGLMPALRAAKITPIEAMRTE